MKVQLKNIICTTDFSDYSNQTIPYGIALAKTFAAKLYICHVIDMSFGSKYGKKTSASVEQENQMRDYAYKTIEELVGKEPVDWEPLVTVGPAADEIDRLVKEKNADIVISATRVRSGLKRLVLGSVTEHMIRTLPCPLVVLRGSEEEFITAENIDTMFQRILIGYDFSPYSEKALEHGLSLAKQFQSELHLVHVMEPPVYKYLLNESQEKNEENFRQDLIEEYNKKLAAMIPEEDQDWCKPKTTLLIGKPHVELNNYATSNNIDLMILGTRGIGLVETLFLGSTTDRVVREAPCPVLSVCLAEQEVE